MRAPPKKHTPATMHPSQIAPRLAALRDALGLTKPEIARAISCDPSLWNKFETGSRPITDTYAFHLAERFGVTMDFVFRGRLDAVPEPLKGEIFRRMADR